jgi:hypothetical protein
MERGDGMPHAGLMDERSLGPEEGPLMRARLHIRGGKRRLIEGKIAAGIVTLYDALNGAMEWYIASPERMKRLLIAEGDDLSNDRSVYRVLVQSQVLDGRFDFVAFDRLVETALHEEMPEYNYCEMLNGLEAVMIRLGVMPFDESALPHEDSQTY